MMNVRRMRSIVDVTVAGKMPKVVHDAAERWQATPVVHVRSSANHVFRLVLRDSTAGYLRLIPAAERSRDTLQAEVEFIQHVARAGVAVARPIPSEAGSFVEEFDDPELGAPQPSYFALVFAGLPGRQMEQDELGEKHYRAWGSTLAQLHQASQTLPILSARSSVRDEIRRAHAGLPDGERAVARVLEAGMAWLETLPVHTSTYGLLHGDCELDNLIWNDQQPQILDFDGALYGPYMLDVAIALQEIWTPENAARDDCVAWFCDGYRELRPLPSPGLDALPRLITLMTSIKIAQLLRAYAPASSDAGAAEAPDSPWLVKMRARHERWLDIQRSALHWM